LTNDDNLNACAALVQRGDPARFAATMAAPIAARARLFPVYAFNIEVARAPWLTQEPMIAEMRLQWWRDALDEIKRGGAVRRHEVVTPLSEVIDTQGAELLDRLIAARRWDIAKEPFEDAGHFEEHIQNTAGNLMLVAARSLGPVDEETVRDTAYAAGLANWFIAIPALVAAGRIPLVDGRPAAVADLAQNALNRLYRARTNRAAISPAACPALLTAWQAGPVLKQAMHLPSRVLDGTLGTSEFTRRSSLIARALSGRW